MELQAWPVIKPHNSELPLSSLWLAFLEGMKNESGYKSFFENAEHE